MANKPTYIPVPLKRTAAMTGFSIGFDNPRWKWALQADPKCTLCIKSPRYTYYLCIIDERDCIQFKQEVSVCQQRLAHIAGRYCIQIYDTTNMAPQHITFDVRIIDPYTGTIVARTFISEKALPEGVTASIEAIDLLGFEGLEE